MTDYTELVSIGDKFGMLTVIDRLPKRIYKSSSKRMWLCRCECGKTKAVQENNLRSGRSRSCGCASAKSHIGLRKKNARSRERLYRIWVSMCHRCRRENGKTAKWYKGVTVCDEWKDFNVFFKWAINNGYHPSLSIDRIDGNKGYSPDNCRWATAMEQANNIRTNIHLTLNGTTHTIPEWSRLLKVSPRALYLRHYSGWSDEKILTTPVKSKQNKVSNYG